MLRNEPFSGLLMTVGADAVSTLRSQLQRGRVLRALGSVLNTRWDEFEYRVDVPLTRNDENRLGPFTYSILCRISGARLLLLGPHKKVVLHLVGTELARTLLFQLRPVAIGVDAFVRHLTNNPSTRYGLTFVHARVPAFGSDLRTVSFYGDDLANAKFFRDGLPLMSCHTCGIRLLTNPAEILRLGNDGGVRFLYKGPKRLEEVERALGALSAEGFLGKTTAEPTF